MQDGLAEYSCKAVRYNPYLLAYPIYHISGRGVCELSVNGNSFSVELTGEAYIDTERKLVYRSDGTAVNKAAKGDFEESVLAFLEKMKSDIMVLSRSRSYQTGGGYND